MVGRDEEETMVKKLCSLSLCLTAPLKYKKVKWSFFMSLPPYTDKGKLYWLFNTIKLWFRFALQAEKLRSFKLTGLSNISGVFSKSFKKKVTKKGLVYSGFFEVQPTSQYR